MSSVTITAHTGCMNTKMNSIDSIITGINNGADIVEIDLNFDSSNNPVLSHNPPEGGEVTLEEAFRTISDYVKIKVNVDVKNTAGLSIVETLAEKYNIIGRVFFTGVEKKYLSDIKKCKKIPYYLNIDISDKESADSKEFQQMIVSEIKNSRAIGINVNYSNVTASFIEAMHRNNIPVSGWTAENPETIKKMLEMNFDNITTTRPDMLYKIIKSEK